MTGQISEGDTALSTTTGMGGRTYAVVKVDGERRFIQVPTQDEFVKTSIATQPFEDFKSKLATRIAHPSSREKLDVIRKEIKRLYSWERSAGLFLKMVAR
jgi:hypothetical protein